jgi:hypothetical protein
MTSVPGARSAVRCARRICKPREQSTEGRLQGQARPNVLFEAGLALGAHPDKTVIHRDQWTLKASGRFGTLR